MSSQTRALVRSVLDVVPIDEALEVLTEHVAKLNRRDPILAVQALRGERSKPAIDDRSGPSWSTDEAANHLKKSSETIRKYVAANKLVAYSAPGDRTRLRLPVWQFRDRDVHEWVSRLIAAFGANGWGLVDFVTAPRTHLNGSHYLHLLQSGRSDDVMAAARRSNPDPD
jgi:hypothetical protein